MTSFYQEYFQELDSKVNSANIHELDRCCNLVSGIGKNNKKIIIVGNGGSATIASHVSVDLTKLANIRAINFNEADLITCFANDYGYENWVARGLEAYADKDDLVVLISSSGRSPNIINGAFRAKELELNTITLSGFDIDNPLKKLGDINLWVDSKIYNIVELTHTGWLLTIIDKVIHDKKGSK